VVFLLLANKKLNSLFPLLKQHQEPLMICVRTVVVAISICLAMNLLDGTAMGGVIFGHSGLGGGSRWDAAPRMISGNERSLAGGLRYSLDGGSFEAYRDMFQWTPSVPSVANFQQAIEQAFAAWESVDPASGLGTTLSFVADLATYAWRGPPKLFVG